MNNSKISSINKRSYTISNATIIEEKNWLGFKTRHLVINTQDRIRCKPSNTLASRIFGRLDDKEWVKIYIEGNKIPYLVNINEIVKKNLTNKENPPPKEKAIDYIQQITTRPAIDKTLKLMQTKVNESILGSAIGKIEKEIKATKDNDYIKKHLDEVTPALEKLNIPKDQQEKIISKITNFLQNDNKKAKYFLEKDKKDKEDKYSITAIKEGNNFKFFIHLGTLKEKSFSHIRGGEYKEVEAIGGEKKVKLISKLFDEAIPFAKLKRLNEINEKDSRKEIRKAKEEKVKNNKREIYIYNILEGQEGIAEQYICSLNNENALLLHRYDGNLSQIMNLNYTTKLKLLRDIAIGLRNMHENGVLHLDVKPRNLLFKLKDPKKELSDENIEKAVLCDLSYALLQSEIKKKKSLLKLEQGTPPYLPAECCPKKAQNKEERKAIRNNLKKIYGFKDKHPNSYGESIDVYGFGRSMFEILFGGLPISKTDPKIPSKSINGEEVDEELKKLLLKLLSFDPSERPKMSEVVDFLNRY